MLVVRTKRDARKKVYHDSGPYDEKRCVAYVGHCRGIVVKQCERKPGFGPAKLYCKQHAKYINRNYGDRI